ncbi:MAG: hypothetical protein ACYCOU_10150, partial [Sulfobacillus sp.]
DFQVAAQQWNSDPSNPLVAAKMLNAKAHMLMALSSAKKASGGTGSGKLSGFGAYALYRMAAEGYTHNPELLKAIPAFAKALGVALPPDISKILQTVPHDQPLSPVTGQPIGTSMPGAPTGSTRSQAQTAARIITELPRIQKDIATLGGDLGPVMGRWNEFAVGKYGKGDPRFEKLRTDLQFVAAAAAKFHLNSVRAVQEFNHLASAGKMTPEVLQAYLESVDQWALTAAAQIHGQGETEKPGTPTANDPLGILQ